MYLPVPKKEAWPPIPQNEKIGPRNRGVIGFFLFFVFLPVCVSRKLIITKSVPSKIL